jgi:hypothetical protein
VSGLPRSRAAGRRGGLLSRCRRTDSEGAAATRARERFRGCGSSLLRLGLSPPRSHLGRDLPRRVAARNAWRATPPPANRSGPGDSGLFQQADQTERVSPWRSTPPRPRGCALRRAPSRLGHPPHAARAPGASLTRRRPSLSPSWSPSWIPSSHAPARHAPRHAHAGGASAQCAGAR